jgi:small-conductance mechanosensitive channel
LSRRVPDETIPSWSGWSSSGARSGSSPGSARSSSRSASLGLQQLAISEGTRLTLGRLFLTVVVAIWLVASIRVGTLFLRAAVDQEDRFHVVEERTFPLFDNISKVVLIGIATYLVIAVWNVDASGWLASAGIVGIVIGLAAQDSLANLFAGAFIIADAPYQVGDHIVLENGQRGRVSQIGLRSTRMITRDDVEVTVPNAVIGSAQITNETRGPHTKHRVRVAVGVAYGSDLPLVRQILMEAATGEALACRNPEPRVRFRAFGESSLDFELLAWVRFPEDRGQLLDLLYSTIYRRLTESGVTIPFPQRDLHVKSWSEEARPLTGVPAPETT